MPDYRLYVWKPDGKIGVPPLEVFAASDDVAINYAMSQDCPNGCEIWDQVRFVAFVTSPDTHRPRALS